MPNDFNITAPIRASEFVKDLLPIGTRVRSFDFPCRDTDGENACFMEGTITGFQRVAGCLRYVIRVERAVFGGKEQKDFPRNVFPPPNGTPTMLGNETDGIEVLG